MSVTRVSEGNPSASWETFQRQLFRELDDIKASQKSSYDALTAQINSLITEMRSESARVDSLENSKSFMLGWVGGLGVASGMFGAWVAKLLKLT